MEISPIGYTHPYTVQTYDIESRRRMTVAALVKLMQEAAMQNVIQLKLSVWDMQDRHISWVLLRKSLKINRLPMIGETIKVVTYPAGFERVFTYRDYKVFDQNDNLLAHSSSTWLLLNTQTRRMVKIPDFILAFKKHMPPPEQCLPKPEAKLGAPDRVDLENHFRVNWHDLDFNSHLNNVFYIQWMVETMPDEVLEKGNLKSFDIQYKVEGHWKDEIVSQTQILDNRHFLHRLLRKEDNKELAIAQSEWA